MMVPGGTSGSSGNSVKGLGVGSEKPQAHAIFQPVYLISSLRCSSTTRMSTSCTLLGAEFSVAEAHEYTLCSLQVQLPAWKSERHHDLFREASESNRPGQDRILLYASFCVATQGSLQGAHICDSTYRHRSLIRKQASSSWQGSSTCLS